MNDAAIGELKALIMQWKKAFWRASRTEEWYGARMLDLTISDANKLLETMEAARSEQVPRRKAG